MREYTIPDPDYPTELIDRLKRSITPQIIKAIAASDYGFDDPEHKAAIKRILSEDRVPRPIEWEPGEPFSLCKWWDEANHEKHEIRGLSRSQANIARAFSCACLLTDTEYGTGEPFDEMIRLVDSVSRLDAALAPPYFEMLCWIQQSRAKKKDEDSRYETMAAELCKCLLKSMNPSCPLDLSFSIPKLIQSEQAYRDELEVEALIYEQPHTGYRNWNQWLIGMSNFDQSWDICFELARRLLQNPNPQLSQIEKDCCRELASLIL